LHAETQAGASQPAHFQFCGLAMTDIRTETDYGEAALNIQVWDNGLRRLNNDKPRRLLPIHPESLRFGIMAYAARIKALGYKHLFLMLRSATSRSPRGDRYCDAWSKAKLAGTLAHPLRNAFNDELKQKRVSEEMRADMMGHGSKRDLRAIRNAFKLNLQTQDMEDIPVLTPSIANVTISIIPCVEAHQGAPWSRPSRKSTR
jgi:hypothetical protein